jgi:hypothetical protein
VKRLLPLLLVCTFAAPSRTTLSETVQLPGVACRHFGSFIYNQYGHIEYDDNMSFAALWCPVPVTNDIVHSSSEYRVLVQVFDGTTTEEIRVRVCTSGLTALYGTTPRSACSAYVGTGDAFIGNYLLDVRTTSSSLPIYRPYHVVNLLTPRPGALRSVLYGFFVEL